MVGSLEVSYQAGSTRLAVQAIGRVGAHVHGVAEQASQVADGFNGYVEAYQEARNRVPPPLPFAEQLDAIQEHSPDILARLPILAQLEEEHAARTQEAREAYRRLDQAAVAADAATPRFPLMAEPVTNDQVEAGSFSSTSTTATRWPMSSSQLTTSTASISMAPAVIGPGAPAAPTPPAFGGLPIPTPGAASGAGGPAAAQLPTPPSPSPGGRGSNGFGTVPPGVASGQWGRFGPNPGGHQTRAGNRTGGAGDGGRGRSGAPGSSSGWRAGDPGSPVGEAGTARAAAVGSRGVPGAASPGFGPFGPGGRKEEDREHQRALYLEADESADSLVGTDQKTAPPVIGVTPPGAA